MAPSSRVVPSNQEPRRDAAPTYHARRLVQALRNPGPRGGRTATDTPIPPLVVGSSPRRLLDGRDWWFRDPRNAQSERDSSGAFAGRTLPLSDDVVAPSRRSGC